jgi:hypothetical protein
MATSPRSAGKKEYHKPSLKAQIDRALEAFITAGHAVQRVPAVVAPEPPPPAPSESIFDSGSKPRLAVASVIDDLQDSREHAERGTKRG